MFTHKKSGLVGLGSQKHCQKGNAGLHSIPKAVNFQGPALAAQPTRKGAALFWTELCKTTISCAPPWPNVSLHDCHRNQYNTLRMAQFKAHPGISLTHDNAIMAVVLNMH